MPELKSDPNSPALANAHRLGEEVRTLGLDWQEVSQVLYKVEEEWQELKEELAPGITPQRQRVAEELGDLLFSVAQLARHLGIDSETALAGANDKFLQRVRKVEEMIQGRGRIGTTFPLMSWKSIGTGPSNREASDFHPAAPPPNNRPPARADRRYRQWQKHRRLPVDRS